MNNIKIKKTLNLHKYSLRVNDIMLNWKIILPLIFAVAGIVCGAVIAKGEGALYRKLCETVIHYILNGSERNIYENILIYLLIPTSFAVALFFSGLSVFGVLTSVSVPLAYSFINSMLVYYFYSEYALKGLAYTVIILFPYIIISLYSLIIITGESISMSGYLLNTMSKSSGKADYNFKMYYKQTAKGYLFIIISVAIKTIVDGLFIDLFAF